MATAITPEETCQWWDYIKYIGELIHGFYEDNEGRPDFIQFRGRLWNVDELYDHKAAAWEKFLAGRSYSDACAVVAEARGTLARYRIEEWHVYEILGGGS